MRDNLLMLLNEREDLPPLPELVIRIDEELRDKQADLNKIVQFIETDSVLSGRVLKMANSAFYGGGRKEVSKLNLAITRLGFKEIRKIVYSVEMSKMFRYGVALDHHQFWRHSLAVALTTQALSHWANASEEEVDNAYLAGLMHDIGLMVFAFLIPNQYADFLEEISEKEIPLYKLEAGHFGIDHAEFGHAFIARWWSVDESVMNAVKMHHIPTSGDDSGSKTNRLVHIANVICNTLGCSNGLNVHCEMFREGAWDALGLTLAMVDNILQDVLGRIDLAEQMLEG